MPLRIAFIFSSSLLTFFVPSELPQQHDSNQVQVSNQDQEDPLTPQIKLEQEEPCTSLVEEQPTVKQEDYLSNSNPSCERSDHSGVWALVLNCDQNLSETGKEPTENMSTQSLRTESASESSGVSESSHDHQLLCDTSYQANSQEYKSSNHGHTTRQEERHKLTSTSNTRLKEEQNDQESNTYSLENTKLAEPKRHAKTFKCDSCNKDFHFFRQLIFHMKIHNAEKPFSCIVCGKGFLFKRYLTQHMISHSSERPFTCNKCLKTFRRLHHLKNHMRSHDKPYFCDVCGKTLRGQIEMKIHIMNFHPGKKLCRIDTSW